MGAVGRAVASLSAQAMRHALVLAGVATDALNVAMVCNSHHLGPHGEVDNAAPAEDCSQIPSAFMPLVA